MRLTPEQNEHLEHLMNILAPRCLVKIEADGAIYGKVRSANWREVSIEVWGMPETIVELSTLDIASAEIVHASTWAAQSKITREMRARFGAKGNGNG